ncbi:hypothetical protein OCOJLMKI_4511 [Methylobacterium iners]|uniref:Uncharacterized protein n=1 Tax=Methylobacterium iners TaxID=418707 RepID=A0ABQ4S2D0_9HYPH|nr:hypothetical protein OCOJLMKI_4511 [Methylobacterium iners]
MSERIEDIKFMVTVTVVVVLGTGLNAILG